MADADDKGAGAAGAAGAGGAGQAAEDGKAGAGGAGEAGKGDAGAAAGAGSGGAGDGAGAGAAGVAGAAGDGKGAGAKTTWPDDWRTRVAGNDDKALQRLGRFASPEAMWQSYRALEQRVSSGELKSVLPKEGATEEQVKAWRAENGIPEAADKYELKLKGDRKLDDTSKPIVEGFLKQAHTVNLSAAQASEAVNWFMDHQESMKAAQAEKDAGFVIEGEEALRADWGQDFRLNKNLITGLLDTAPAGVKDNLMGGRLADGKPFMSDPATLKFLIGLAREINPVSTVVPNAGANMASAVEDEIAAWEGKMGNRSSDYWKGPNAEKNQARYRELVTYRDKQKPKAA